MASILSDEMLTRTIPQHNTQRANGSIVNCIMFSPVFRTFFFHCTVESAGGWWVGLVDGTVNLMGERESERRERATKKLDWEGRDRG